MNFERTSQAAPPRYHPLFQLVIARLREFYREPEALFWVYGFPILMVVALGIAFRNKPVDKIPVDIETGDRAESVSAVLSDNSKFSVHTYDAEVCRQRLRTGKTEVVVHLGARSNGGYEYLFDPSRPESVLARNSVDDALQRAAGRKDAVPVHDVALDEPGGRYIDFLVPGLLAMSLMGGGLWGVGFVTVDMRIRKLLKRFLATPMRKSDFLAGIILSRLVFMVPEMTVLLLFARFAFHVVVQGSFLALAVLMLLGAFTFAGLGLLVASRARTIEAVSGLMNLVMLPMWVLSGIFFSAERFPELVQPAIRVLPLTPLINSLRAVSQEGTSLSALGPEMGVMATWAIVSFALALRFFRWN